MSILFKQFLYTFESSYSDLQVQFYHQKVRCIHSGFHNTQLEIVVQNAILKLTFMTGQRVDRKEWKMCKVCRRNAQRRDIRVYRNVSMSWQSWLGDCQSDWLTYSKPHNQMAFSIQILYVDVPSSKLIKPLKYCKQPSV